MPDPKPGELLPSSSSAATSAEAFEPWRANGASIEKSREFFAAEGLDEFDVRHEGRARLRGTGRDGRVGEVLGA